MSVAASHSGYRKPLGAGVIAVLIAVAVGLLGGVGLACIRDASPKQYVPAIAGCLFLLLVATCKYGEEICLFSFLVFVPLPMHAFLIKLDPLHGGGALGIYALASDAPFALLLIFWFFDWAKGAPVQRRSPAQALLLFPFLLIGFISIGYSEKPLWAFCEWVRWVKVLAVLLYVIYRVRAKDIDLVLFGLSASILLEAGIAALQAGFRSNLGLDKLGVLGAGGEQALTQEVAVGTLFRGSALSGHPNFLAGYLLLLLPLFGFLALAETRKPHRLCWSATFLVGAAGLAATMSRGAIASFLVACGVELAAAVAFRLAPARRCALIAVLGLLTLGTVALFFHDAILERIHADWGDSWELRSHLNNSAIAIAQDHIVLGVGLNNYTLAYPSYNPDFAATLMEMDNMLTSVHNLYLLVWAEVGTLGLAAFLLFLVGDFVVALHSVGTLDKQGRCLMLGFSCGLLAAMANDLTEFTLWIDLNMFTTALLAGMLPALRERALALRGVYQI